MVKEMFYDLDFTQAGDGIGVYGLTTDGVYFLTELYYNDPKTYSLEEIYYRAINSNLHVRFENQKVRDELTGLRAE